MILVLGLASLGLIPQAAGDAEAKAALQKLSERFRDVKTISAKFTQRRTTTLVKEPLVSSGTFYYRRDPARMVFHVAEPARTEIHLDKTTYQVYRPDQKRLERIEFEDPDLAPRLLMIFDPKPEEIGKAFALRSGPAGEGEIEVRLDPADEKLRRHLRSITLVLAVSDGTLKRMAYADAEGDETRFEFAGIALNPSLAEDLFDLRPAEGTRILRHTLKSKK